MSAAKEAAHTPGPWKTHLVDETVVIIPRRTPQHVSALGASEIADAEDYANARLIAAAPELLEALVALHVVARVDRDENYSAVANAAAVIAKATGAAAPAAPSLALTAFIQDVEAAEGKETPELADATAEIDRLKDRVERAEMALNPHSASYALSDAWQRGYRGEPNVFLLGSECSKAYAEGAAMRRDGVDA